MARRWSLTLMMLLFGVGYALTFSPFVKVIRYYPAQHMWAFEGPDPSMAWFGKILIAAVLGAIGLVIGIVLDKRGVASDSTAAKVFDALGWIAAMTAMTVAAVHNVQVWIL